MRPPQSILDALYESRRRTLLREIEREPLAQLEGRAARVPRDPRRFRRSLKRAPGIGIIGEIKCASPSLDTILDEHRDPDSIVREFESAGVDAISVVTEERFFGGSVALLDIVRAATRLPILRKDFLTKPYEIVQSAAYGADAVLLILCGLEDRQIVPLVDEAARCRLDVVFEVHDSDELRRALRFQPTMIGINNRELRTFEVSLDVSRRLLPLIPHGVLPISESGLKAPRDVLSVARMGAGACLIGEALLRTDDAASFVAACRPSLVA